MVRTVRIIWKMPRRRRRRQGKDQPGTGVGQAMSGDAREGESEGELGEEELEGLGVEDMQLISRMGL